MASQKELQAAARLAKKNLKAKTKAEEEKAAAIKARNTTVLEKEPEAPPPIVKEKIKTHKEIEAEEIQLQRDILAEEIRIEKSKRKTNDWDVKIGEAIEYFDPELSYELTGYRPISMTKGLDFDPTPFKEVGQVYEDTGKYCTFLPGSKLFVDFWTEQMKRCIEGYTVGRYTVTGDNYFWLNFYRIPNAKGVGKAGSGRAETFPDFFSKQYEYFHYIDICERCGYDVGALKARGVGFSEVAACLGVRTYTTTKGSRSLYTASAEKFVKDVLEKAWLQLEFLNTETQGGFKRLRMKKDTDMIKRASKVTKEGTEYGHMATIQGVVADTARKLRGGRVERLLFEEAGSNPILVTAYNQSEALVNLMGKRIGTRYVWGKIIIF